MSNRRVKLLAVGNTLASEAPHPLSLARYGAALGRPLMTPAHLVERLPELQQVAVVEPGRDFYGVSPDAAGPVLWRSLAEHLRALFHQDADVSGVVIVHGTNVIEETAYFLNLTVRVNRPVVLVGAQRPWNVLSSDGPLNLVNAVRVAADPGAAGRGALVVANDTIHAARDVTKTSTYRLHTFQSPDVGPLGFVDADAVVFYRRAERRHTVTSEFDLAEVGEFPRVDIVYGYSGVDGGLVRAAVALGARGIVTAGVGAGAVTGMKEALEEAAREGVVVVRSSRLGSGRVLAEDNSVTPGLVAADNLNPQKARVLLLLALTRTGEPAEVQRMFNEY